MAHTHRTVLVAGADHERCRQITDDLIDAGHLVVRGADRAGARDDATHPVDLAGAIDGLVLCADAGNERAADDNAANAAVVAVQVVRDALPSLRASGDGRIVVVTGSDTGPKRTAVGEIEDGVRSAIASLRPLGVHVATVETGYSPRTGLVVSRSVVDRSDEPVFEPLQNLNRVDRRTLRRIADSPVLVSLAVRDALESRRPRRNYPLGALAEMATLLRGACDEDLYPVINDLARSHDELIR